MHGGLAQGIAQALFEEAELRRAGHAGQRHVRRLHPALGVGPAELHHGPHRDPVDGQPAGRQGGRRGGHDRLDAGDRQRGDRRGAPPRRAATSRCRARRSACGGPSRRRRAVPPRRRRSTPTRRVPASARSTRTTRRKKRSSDPGAVRLRQARHGRRGRGGAAARPVRTPRSSPAGRASSRCCGCGWPRRPMLIDLGGIPELRRIRDDGDRIAIGAMAPHHDVHARRPRAASTSSCWPRPRRRSPTTRSGTAAPSAGRSRTPTPPATSAASHWPWRRSS